MLRIALLLACLWSTGLDASRVAATANPIEAPPPALTATFETTLRDTRHAGHIRRERWTLSRETDRIAYSFDSRGAAGPNIDAWTRTGGESALARIFPADRTVVEYTEGQLRALGILPNWQQLSFLLPRPPQHMGLRRVGTTSALQRQAIRYKGSWRGARVTVTWLQHEQLPAALSITRSGVERRIELRQLSLDRVKPLARDPWPGYRRIDASDLGDLEHDRFVQRHAAQLLRPHQH